MAKLENTELSFDTFKPRDYLKLYYSDEVREGTENWEILKFIHDAYANLPPQTRLAEIGGGPTLYQLVTPATHVKEIVFTDYVFNNLEEVALWKRGKGFNWSSFIEASIKIEKGGEEVDPLEVKNRASLLRSKLARIKFGNILDPDPLGPTERGSFDVVNSFFCAESITEDKSEWEKSIDNLTSLLKPGGILVTAALKGADWYSVGDRVFPATNINEEDLLDRLARLGFYDFYCRTISADHNPESSLFTGYTSMIFLRAIRG